MIQNHRPLAVTNADFRLWSLRLAALLLGLLALSGSNAGGRSASNSLAVAATDAGAARTKPQESRMWMTVGQRRFALTLADTDAARAFAAQLPLTLDMGDLNGNEKKFDFSKNLPADATRPGTIRNGDLMLYGTNTLVLFYLTFESSYSYTRVGRVDDSTGLADALGKRNVRVEFSAQ
jgi:hypothetical protein